METLVTLLAVIGIALGFVCLLGLAQFICDMGRWMLTLADRK